MNLCIQSVMPRGYRGHASGYWYLEGRGISAVQVITHTGGYSRICLLRRTGAKDGVTRQWVEKNMRSIQKVKEPPPIAAPAKLCNDTLPIT